MRILSITAQKPSDTGSGVYLTEIVKCLNSFHHEQAVVYGTMPSDAKFAINDSVEISYPVCYLSNELDFPIAGMSDNMPYESTRYCDFTSDMTNKFIKAFSSTIKRAICEFKPELIVCHHLYLTTSITKHIADTLPTSPKIIAICHGTDLRQMHKHNLCSDYIKKGISLIDKVFVLNKEQIEEVSETYGITKSKIEILGTGYNSNIFKPSSNPFSNENNSIIYAGKICYQKGVSELILASSALSKKIEGLTLTLVGGHSNEGEYKKIVKTAKSANIDVRFTGPLKQQELSKLYQTSKVFCLPSFFEGLPLVSLEAIACGCTCVMTDLTGIKSWYSENATNAPIIYVAPPRMKNVDVPNEGDLPSFRDNLTCTLNEAFSLKPNPNSVTHLSWNSLTNRLLKSVSSL